VVAIVKACAVGALLAFSDGLRGPNRHQFFKKPDRFAPNTPNKKVSSLQLVPDELPIWIRELECISPLLLLSFCTQRCSPTGPGPENIPIHMWALIYQAYAGILSPKTSSDVRNSGLEPHYTVDDDEEELEDRVFEYPDNNHADLNRLNDCRSDIAIFLSFLSTFELLRGTAHVLFEKIYEELQSGHDAVTMQLF